MSAGSPTKTMSDLATGVLIGTDRNPAFGKPTELLDKAAVLGACARAGYTPARVTARIALCPADSQPVARSGQMSLLVRLLVDPDFALIEEWAELARGKGVRVADSTVPLLLDWWARQPRKSEIIHEVMGKRATWLATFNESWKRPVAGGEVPADAESIWQTGKGPERTALLKTVRRSDPARGLSLVQSTWTTDSADERRKFVEALVDGLSMHDEPFLEASLDDKSKTVRRAAADLLTRLPGSRLKGRMNERAETMIAREEKRKLLKKTIKITLTPPREFEKTWERDGIEEQPAGNTGKRAWWMKQVLGAADLSVWIGTTKLEPPEVLDALSGDDYEKDAIVAITQATTLAGDGAKAWATALLEHTLEKDKLDVHEIAPLWQSLSEQNALGLVLHAAMHKRFGPVDRWTILACTKTRWTKEFSAKAMSVLAADASKVKEKDWWLLYEPVSAISRTIHPSHADQFESLVMDMFPDQPTDSFRKSIDRARLRAEMHKEFAS